MRQRDTNGGIHSRCPSTSINEEHIAAAKKIVLENRRITVKKVVEKSVYELAHAMQFFFQVIGV